LSSAAARWIKMFVSVLTLFLILRRSGLKVKMFPRRSRDEKKGGL
jgi:hypothetical protein